MATPNQQCPSFFARPSSSARSRAQSLLNGLRSLHQRWTDPPSGATSDATSSGSSSRPGSRPASAYSVYSAYSHSSSASSAASALAGAAIRDSEPPAPKPRGAHDTGVGIEFLQEVFRHAGPNDTVAQLTDTLLAPAAKQAGTTSFLAIPRLVHAQFVGPPTHVIALDPATMRYQTLVALLRQHSEQHTSPDGRPPRYYLDCFAGFHHAPCGQQSPQYQAQRVESARRAASQGDQGARKALLLLDSGCSALTLAWALHDALWVVKAHGPQALDVLPYGEASLDSLLPALEQQASSLDIARCRLPGNAAQQWEERQKLAKALEGHSVSLEAFGIWIREALAHLVRRCRAGSPGEMPWEEEGNAASSKVFLSSATPHQLPSRPVSAVP